MRNSFYESLEVILIHERKCRMSDSNLDFGGGRPSVLDSERSEFGYKRFQLNLPVGFANLKTKIDLEVFI